MRTLADVLHTLIDKVQMYSEQEAVDAHEIVDEYFRDEPDQPDGDDDERPGQHRLTDDSRSADATSGTDYSDPF